jgi:outer membrane lipoprotein SlyB
MRLCERIIAIAIIPWIPIATGGCHSSKPLWGAGSTVGGAAIGAAVSRTMSDQAWAPVAGALAGGIVGAGVYHTHKSEQEEEFASGYEQGLSDSIKRQYWIQARMQRLLESHNN